MSRFQITRRSFVTKASAGALALASGVSSQVEGTPSPIDVPSNLQDSWVEIKKGIYGAKPDGSGPIGGGKGYGNLVTSGDFVVQDFDELLKALAVAKPGQVVFIPAETWINLTTHIYIDEFVLKIPEGVTLASDRGYKGSKGALLTSHSHKTPAMITAGGPNVRITGLRIQGPNPHRHLEHHKRSFGPGGLGREYYYKFPVSRGIVTDHPGLEVDNCEISAFSASAIYLRKGDEHHIHHNFIHQCQYNGLGYGISHGAASSLIERNTFNENRHSLAGTGVPQSGYIARHNIELGVSLSHCFDMHGGRDRKDETDIAGTTIEIYNNTFRAPETAVVIRGIPEEKCEVYHNWFVKHQDVEQAVRGISNKTIVFNNVYGKKPTEVK